MPQVSAIITTFNRANFLEKAIKSVLGQTYSDFELLILDNSSIDDTQNVVKSFIDDRIRYIRHQPLNIAQARNLGVKEAKGEYVAFLDDDDEWLPNKLKAQLEVFKEGDESLGLVYGGFIWMAETGEDIKKHIPKLRGAILPDLLTQRDAFTGSASNPMLRKSAVEGLGGYNEEVLTGEDWELYLRLSEEYQVDFTEEPVVKIRHHSGARLGDKLKSAAELELMVMDRYREIFEKNQKLKSFYFQKIGGKFYRSGEVKKGKDYIARAIKIYPANFSAYGQYILSFFGQIFYRGIHKTYQSVKKNFLF